MCAKQARHPKPTKDQATLENFFQVEPEHVIEDPAEPQVPQTKDDLDLETIGERLLERYFSKRIRARGVTIVFYPYKTLKSTVRKRGEIIHIRISDILEDAPPEIILALCSVLCAKIVGEHIPRQENLAYRHYVLSENIQSRVHTVRATRGSKVVVGPVGDVYDLRDSFKRVREQYFDETMQMPTLTWSKKRNVSQWGHYDPDHDTIVVSRIFDHPKVPEYVLDYIVYHELLHIVHPIEMHGARKSVHTKGFKQAEKDFLQFKEANTFLRELSRQRHKYTRNRS